MQVKGRSIIGSEDCLYLNVWSPQKCHGSSNASCTVMLWIHGGSYVTGGTKGMFNGTRLAEQFGVIVVTVNYRLGILGFAGAEALRSRDPMGSTGNYGIQETLAPSAEMPQICSSLGRAQAQGPLQSISLRH